VSESAGLPEVADRAPLLLRRGSLTRPDPTQTGAADQGRSTPWSFQHSGIQKWIGDDIRAVAAQQPLWRRAPGSFTVTARVLSRIFRKISRGVTVSS